MFTFDATPVKFVGLLVLFAWCTVWCVYESARPQVAKQRVSNLLHLLMAVVMLLMVPGWTWKPLVGVVPLPALVAVFVAATAWFVVMAVGAFRAADRRGGMHLTGHAAMFGAMTWHLAAMAVMAAGMSGMGHGGMGDAARQPGGILWAFALVGLPFMAYLLAAGVLGLRRALRPAVSVPGDSREVEHAAASTHASGSVALSATPDGEHRPAAAAPDPDPAAAVHGCHEERVTGTVTDRLAALCDAAMNLGMFWMSTGLITPILPFFAVLAF
ncbi:DUF5134 domain-containing protein [Propionicicella superfundia]|uniref:DUF5134 domain-containing protein n=1 Tax=Propionicicella superfundia TaxID=348582 RepID=UPI0004201ADB|nr:DUF5134 domain-containing protein [Propionicicella superfundia]